MKVGVVCFPGSNCDHDVHHAVGAVMRAEVEYVWHKETSVDGFDALVLSGGFSYGDYLRCGAIARFSPVMRALRQFAADGGAVLGICNGFQILVEAGMLPGALLPNAGLKFRCQDLTMRVERTDTPYTSACRPGQILRMHMAHYEGNYFADAKTVAKLEENNQVVMRFCGPDGGRRPEYNPNGSVSDIAAVASPDGKILGLMPHPERCVEVALGGTDGRLIFESMLHSLQPAARLRVGDGELASNTVNVTSGD